MEPQAWVWLHEILGLLGVYRDHFREPNLAQNSLIRDKATRMTSFAVPGPTRCLVQGGVFIPTIPAAAYGTTLDGMNSW